MAEVLSNGIVAPHGGRLVDRVLRGGALEEARRRGSSLKRIALNARTMSDLELLAGGAYSPLEGFMGEADYKSVLREMRLASGLPWTLPITLAVRRAAADALRDGDEVALVSPWEEPLGILRLEERFLYDGREEARLGPSASRGGLSAHPRRRLPRGQGRADRAPAAEGVRAVSP
jgi:sulfate adenylyltransferase